MDYIKKVEENFPEEVSALQELIRCESVAGEPFTCENGDVYPFGKGVQDAFEYTLAKSKEFGFECANIDNYGGHVDFGNGEETVGIVGHIDVVPAGDGWDFDAFSGDVDGGYIYGRGTTDDKGPVIACLYAMKALKDCGYEPGKKIRLILGLDEEKKWAGMDYYLSKVPTPDFGFTPDGDFPVIHGEKGIVTFSLVKKMDDRKMTGLELRSFEGGQVPNMVAEKARAVVKAENTDVYDEIKEKARLFREEKDLKISVRGMGKSLEISAEGKAAHGAHPELGLNAISILLDFLGQLNFASEDVNDLIDFYNTHLGYEVNGEHFGCALEDELSGKLTVNVGMAMYDRKSCTFVINVRYPVSCSEEETYAGIQEIADRFNMGIIKHAGQDPILMDIDSPLIKTFVDVYRENTGDTESQPNVIGGGTYARAMKNVVAFGGMFPGDPDLMHQKNERLELNRLMTMTKIYADALYRISAENFKF